MSMCALLKVRAIAHHQLSFSNGSGFSGIDVGDFVATLIQAADGEFVSVTIKSTFSFDWSEGVPSWSNNSPQVFLSHLPFLNPAQALPSLTPVVVSFPPSAGKLIRPSFKTRLLIGTYPPVTAQQTIFSSSPL